VKALSGPTLAERLTLAGNRPSGFDYLRLVLSTLVLASHTINVCYGRQFTLDVWAGPARPFLAVILPMFFALSGFLVAGSVERCRTLVSFAGLRVLRIVPALAVETVLSALIIGTVFTDLPLQAYFADARFFSYFENIIGHIHYVLPGVFDGNPWGNSVNNQLWTLPYELMCYTVLTGLLFLGVAQRPRLFVPFLFLCNIGLLVAAVRKGIGPAAMVSGPILVQCFLFGVAAFLYRARIVWSHGLGALALVLTLACLGAPLGDYLAPLPATYLTVYLGLMHPHRIKVLFGGDYSYGIFLYGFPIQQAVVAAIGPHEWYLNLLIAYPITLTLAVFSWRVVEKPALQWKSRLLDLESRVIGLAQRMPGGRILCPPIGIPRR